jgi:hypothetical protein
MEGDGGMIFRHACRLGCERIVSKRFGFALSIRPQPRLDQDEES